MARGPLKSRTVAVKVEEEVADFLDRLPNKSDFIRQAILAQFRMACPLCTGSGTVPRGLGGHYGPVVRKHRVKKCEKCGRTEAIPADAAAVAAADVARWEQFFHGGPLFCAACYAHAAECGECGWHLSADALPEHVRQTHAE
jgi:hypothetical protein